MPANHEMTFVCFGIAKVECQMLNIIGYFFSISYMPMHCLLKRKRMQKRTKSKKNQNTLYMIASVYSRRCGSYRIYLEGDSLHQTIMIVCELKWFFSYFKSSKHIDSNAILRYFSHTTRNILYYLDTCAGTMWFGHHKQCMC